MKQCLDCLNVYVILIFFLMQLRSIGPEVCGFHQNKVFWALSHSGTASFRDLCSIEVPDSSVCPTCTDRSAP